MSDVSDLLLQKNTNTKLWKHQKTVQIQEALNTVFSVFACRSEPELFWVLWLFTVFDEQPKPLRDVKVKMDKD